MPQSGYEDGFTTSSTGSLDVWVSEIHAKVPGAAEEYLYSQLKHVLRDFFVKTKAWRTMLGPFTVVADDGTLCLNPVDAYSQVIQVLNCNINGIFLSPGSPEVPFRAGVQQFHSRAPRSYYVEPYDTIYLEPTPTEDVEQVFVGVALTPRLRDDNLIHQWIIDQHYESVIAGVYHRLFQEPMKAYSNETKAEYWGKKYRSEVSRAIAVADQNYKNGPHPWVYPRHTMGRGQIRTRGARVR